jgi:hypothetical protein
MTATSSTEPSTFGGRRSCERCLEWTTSVESVLAVLNDDSGTSACEGCGSRRDRKVVAEQYRKRRPRWWIVGSTVVVPMWIVESLRTRKPR